MSEHFVGEIIEGTITNIYSYGAILYFSDGSKGLLHISQIANTFIRNIKKYLRVGKTYQVKIINIEEDNFLKVSMSQITQEEKEEYHSQISKKVMIDSERVDSTALQEKIKEWVELEKENRQNG